MTNQPAYQVLARKYRPRVLSELIGQDVLVQTLTNAIEQNRIPHAFMLTGIRGVGKTSTARIIAKCLNNSEGLSATPEADCKQCVAIEESRHTDVLEMDAASRTGVGDIREIIDSVQYAPTMGRYKVYIIDEVHMLSKNAFNALLKTLEEPPENCVFIFATTEIRKVPITILSRCMRFDLPRVDHAKLAAHLLAIADKEGAQLDEQAANLLAYTAEGSVRDSLSLLDQAIGNAGESKNVTFEATQTMLGLSDKRSLFELLTHIIAGDTAAALTKLNAMYTAGADPVVALQDLLEIVHIATVGHVHKGELPYDHLSDKDKSTYASLIENTGIPFLTRLWQMLLKGLEEARRAPAPLTAVEMILIRITYASELPTPEDFIKNFDGTDAPKKKVTTSTTPASPPPSAPAMHVAARTAAPAQAAAVAVAEPVAEGEAITSLEQLIAACNHHSEPLIASHLHEVSVTLFDATEHRFEFCPAPHTPANLSGQLGSLLQQWTGERWMVAVATQATGLSLNAQADQAAAAELEAAKQDSTVQAVLREFPGSKITTIKPLNTE